jgi:hypothetical protein
MSTQEILQSTRDTLEVARQGLSDARSKDPRRRVAGIRNVVVWGRATTEALRRLKRTEPGYQAWWKEHSARMQNDPLMKFFYELRNVILHEAKLPTGYHVAVNMRVLEYIDTLTPPKGAQGFFIGDRLGGSGWVVDLPDGSTETFYVELPDDGPGLGTKVTLTFGNVPGIFKSRSVVDLCEQFLNQIEFIVDDAHVKFARKQN